MKSIKNAFVFLVMLGVVYGVWQMLNKRPIAPPAGMLDGVSWNPPQLDFGSSQSPAALVPPQITPGAVAQTPLSPPRIATAGAIELGGATNAGASPYARAATPLEAPPIAPAPVVSADAYAATGGAPSQLAPSEMAQSSASPAPSIYASVQPEAAPPEPAAASGSTYDRAASALGNTAFLSAWNGAQDQLQKGELAEALFTLTLWYDSADVPSDMRPQLIDTLDQLAGAVIYSPSFQLEEPYEVQPGQRLDEIARQYQIPWQFLAKVNGIQDPARLEPGTRLKVVRGPFNAVVHLQGRELTLLVGRRYAGRFAVSLGNDPEPMPGEYVVREKDIERTFYDRDGRAIPPGDDANPYGPFWIGLGNRMAIHGAPARQMPRDSTGSIVVSPDDARDLFAILSEESQVVIRR